MASFSVREEWKDITPEDEYPPNVLIGRIAYNEQCNRQIVKETMSYFREIIKREEISLRAFQITTEVVTICPGFYTG